MARLIGEFVIAVLIAAGLTSILAVIVSPAIRRAVTKVLKETFK